MDLEHEHLRLKDGKLGLWNIKAEEASGADIWQKIDDIIVAYTKVHPMEVEACVRGNGFISDAANDTNSNKSNSLRWGANVPAGLLFKLQVIEPRLFEDKTLFHSFLRKYKGFSVCKKV